MTNLQEGSPRLSAQNLQRLWLWTPIGLGALVAALLVGLVLFPIGRQLLRDSQRLQKLEALLQERSLLRSQLQAIDAKQQKTQAASDKLLNLIAGRGDLSTFLTRLQQEAQRTGVQLDLFEPQPVVAAGPATQQDGAESPATPSANPDGKGAKPDATGSGPPELEGLRRETSILVVKGDFPALLEFLRRIEMLSVLVVQSDLDLSREKATPKESPSSSPPAPVTLKMNVSLYGPLEKEDRRQPVAAAQN